MTSKQQLQDDIKTAMREGDLQRRDVLRMVTAAIKQTEVDERRELDDAGVEDVLRRQAKLRRESIADYEKAGRADSVASETAELAIIESYLPQQLSRDDVATLAAKVIAELGVTDAKGMGQVMSKLMPQLKGNADGRLVNEVVRELLS
jgi:uncharacterized protein YqeY